MLKIIKNVMFFLLDCFELMFIEVFSKEVKRTIYLCSPNVGQSFWSNFLIEYQSSNPKALSRRVDCLYDEELNILAIDLRVKMKNESSKLTSTLA